MTPEQEELINALKKTSPEQDGIIRVMALIHGNKNQKYKDHYRELFPNSNVKVLPVIISVYTIKKQIGFTVFTKDNNPRKFHDKRPIHKSNHNTDPYELVTALTDQEFGSNSTIILMKDHELPNYLEETRYRVQ